MALHGGEPRRGPMLAESRPVFIGRLSYDKIVSTMVKIAQESANDVKNYKALSIDSFFNFVRRVPYRKEQRETLRAPQRTFVLGGDCDCKTIAVLAWAFIKGISARVVLAGLSEEPGVFRHVFPELFINGQWITFDATYDWCEIGKRLSCYDNFKVYNI